MKETNEKCKENQQKTPAEIENLSQAAV